VAIVKLNPCYESISGRIDSLVFYSYNNITFCRKHVIPYNPRTEIQQKNRNLFKDAVKSWQRLSRFEKNNWNVRSLGASGYNYYISRFMKYQSEQTASLMYKNMKYFNRYKYSEYQQLSSQYTSKEIVSFKAPRSRAPSIFLLKLIS